MSTSPASSAMFTRPVARRLAAVFGVAVAVTLFVSLTAEEPPPTTALPSAYSRSALGYEALSESLQEADMRVLVSRWHSGKRGAPDLPVLALEPLEEHTDELTELLSEAAGQGAPVVVGLPKWEGEATWNGWVHTVSLRSTQDAANTLAILEGTPLSAAAVYRLEEPVACSGTPGVPDIPHSLQLIDSGQVPSIFPVITCDGGVLVGEIPYGAVGRVLVVADPDLWNTHGLANPANPPVAEALLKQTLSARGVIIDETIHGFEKAPSIWQELTTFPLSLFSAHLLGLFLLSVIAAAARFGAPRSLPPRIPPGKGALIENTVRLMEMGGHRTGTVQRYFDATLRRLAEALSLPAGLTRTQQLERLQQHCIALGLQSRPADIAALVDGLPQKNLSPRRALAMAQRIRAMRAELTRSPHAD